MAPKECKACGVEKEGSAGNFYKVYGNRDGLDGTCKECRKKKQAERKKVKDAGETPMSKEERIAKIKERQEALARRKAASTAVGSAARKITKKRKARKMPALPTLSSDRIVSEMIDVANIVKNGKVLLRQKCEELLAALDKEANG